jgi:hypothetical protein
MDTLFEVEPICAKCKGTRRVWVRQLGAYTECPVCTKLADPRLNVVQLPRNPRDTQIQAALKALPRSGTARGKVLEYIAGRGDAGATDDEIAERLRMSPNTARPRRNELMKGGWIEDSTKRRASSAGGEAIVWVLTERGKRGRPD